MTRFDTLTPRGQEAFTALRLWLAQGGETHNHPQAFEMRNWHVIEDFDDEDFYNGDDE